MHLQKSIPQRDSFIYIPKYSLLTLHNLAPYKKGIICTTANYGNWEYLSLTLGKQPYKANIMYHPPDNPFLKKIHTHTKKPLSNTTYKKKAYSQKIKALKKTKPLPY